MRIGGLLKFSLIDYPGRVAAVVFTQGCNYRCPFCHNPELVLPELFSPEMDVEEVMAFLERRRGQLQGVVITGGEPTLHPDLKEFIRRIKDKGFLVKLDTNGSRPDALKEILDVKLVDLVAMDIKSSPEGYARAAGIAVDMAAVKASIELIKASGVAHIFRTTVFKGIAAAPEVKAIIGLLGGRGNYRLQKGSLGSKVLDKSLLDGPGELSDEEWKTLQKEVL